SGGRGGRVRGRPHRDGGVHSDKCLCVGRAVHRPESPQGRLRPTPPRSESWNATRFGCAVVPPAATSHVGRSGRMVPAGQSVGKWPLWRPSATVRPTDMAFATGTFPVDSTATRRLASLATAPGTAVL